MLRRISIPLFIAVLVLATLSISDAKTPKVKIKPKFSSKEKVNYTVTLSNPGAQFIWKFEIEVLKSKSSRPSDCVLRHKSIELYGMNDEGRYMFRGDLLPESETPKESKKFEVQDEFFASYVDQLPKGNKKVPAELFDQMLTLSYVYLPDGSIEIGSWQDAPEHVTKHFKETWKALKVDSEPKISIKATKQAKKRGENFFGVEKSQLIETKISWTNDDRDGIELRGLAVWDAKEKKLAGYKAHMWYAEPGKDPMEMSVLVKSDPPANFTDGDSPKLPGLPRARDKKKDDPSTNNGTGTGVGPGPKKGDAPIDFKCKTLDGKEADFKFKENKALVLLLFWSLDSKNSCELITGKVTQWANDYQAKGLLIICINKDDPAKQLEFLKAKPQIKAAFVHDSDGSITNSYKASSHPFMFIIVPKTEQNETQIIHSCSGLDYNNDQVNAIDSYFKKIFKAQ